MELREGIGWGGVVEDKRKSKGEKEKEVGSGDELKHPVPG